MATLCFRTAHTMVGEDMGIKVSILIPVWNQEVLVIRCLDSIPRRDDIEVLVRDDGSTDRTLDNLIDYRMKHRNLNLRVFYNGTNRGVAYTKNRLLEDARGEYFNILDSDDYLYTEEYSRAVDDIDGSDLCLIDFATNDGFQHRLSPENHNLYCAQTMRFTRKDFAKGIKFPEEIRAADDWYFHIELTERNPSEHYTHIVAYHYNFPREGSLSDLKMKGLI